MATPEKSFDALGLSLPAPAKPPVRDNLPFSFVNVRGGRLLFSGSSKSARDGSIAGPFGVVASGRGHSEQHLVVNGFSNLVIEVFGAKVGRQAQSAIGVFCLPLSFAMEIEGEVQLSL